MSLKIILFKITATSPRDQWVQVYGLHNPNPPSIKSLHEDTKLDMVNRAFEVLPEVCGAR